MVSDVMSDMTRRCTDWKDSQSYEGEAATGLCCIRTDCCRAEVRPRHEALQAIGMSRRGYLRNGASSVPLALLA